jgi:hypothetical protein
MPRLLAGDGKLLVRKPHCILRKNVRGLGEDDHSPVRRKAIGIGMSTCPTHPATAMVDQ